MANTAVRTDKETNDKLILIAGITKMSHVQIVRTLVNRVELKEVLKTKAV